MILHRKKQTPTRNVREGILSLCSVSPGSQVHFAKAPLLTLRVGILLASFCWNSCAVATAQDADPFGADPKPATDEKPAATKTKGKKDKEKKGEYDLRDERDPVVLAIHASLPETPEDLTRAVKLTQEMGRPEVAKMYLAKLKEAMADDAALAALATKFGSDFFLRLTTDERLRPDGVTFGRSVLTASSKAARDPERLTALIEKLADRSPAVSAMAEVDLQAGGTAAIPPLLAALTDPNRAAAQVAFRSALLKQGREAVEPLLGLLESTDDYARVQAITVLGDLGTSRATPYLLRAYLSPASSDELRQAARHALLRIVGEFPSLSDAERFLVKRCDSLLKGTLPVRVDEMNVGTLWHWDGTSKRVAPRQYDSYELTVAEAARIANELFALSPDNIDHRRLFLTTRLETAKLAGGLDHPLVAGPGTTHELAAQFGPEALEDLLVHAQNTNRPPVMIAALNVLGDIGTEELLLSSDGRPRPVAKALAHTDRRVRFAAVEAVLKLNPREPFFGASYVTDSLGYFAASTGARRVLVAHPQPDEAQTYVGILNEMGFEADSASNGRSAFQLAVKQPDYEFAIISDSLDYPATNELLQMLRQDSHSARLTVGLIARPDPREKVARMRNLAREAREALPRDARKFSTPPADDANATLVSDTLDRARRMAESDPSAEAFPRPADAQGLAHVVTRLQARARRQMVPRDERLRQAAAALDWMNRLLETEHRYSFYELPKNQAAVEIAIQTPELTTRAALVLGLLGTPKAQQTLVDFASQNGRPLIERQAAAAGFKTAVERRRLLLSQAAIKVQYDRYNASEFLDKETQAVLNSILDVIQPPKKTDVTEAVDVDDATKMP